VWDPKQNQKAACAGAAAADALWYLDQHDFPCVEGRCLVKHVDVTEPNDTWHDKAGGTHNGDARDLVNEVGRAIYGRDYVAGTSPLPRGPALADAVKNYIVGHGYGHKAAAPGLVVDSTGAGNLNYNYYATWKATLLAGYETIATIAWRDAQGKKMKEAGATFEFLHAITGAGVETDDHKLVIVHGWEDHPGGDPPYKDCRPNCGAGERPYINIFDMTLENMGRSIKIVKNDDNPDNKQLVNRLLATHHVSVESFVVIKPGNAPALKIDGKKQAGNPPQGNGPKTTKFSYTIENDTFPPVYQFALEVPVPFDFSTVEAPAGWLAVPWDPTETPAVTPAPPISSENAEDADPDTQPYEFTIRGILFYKDPDPTSPGDPVFSGSSLDGFSYEVPDVYRTRDTAVTAIGSDGRSAIVDPDWPPGLYNAHRTTFGPVATIDHFQCYEVKRRVFATPDVTLVDAFGTTSGVVVQQPERLCAPANKNNEAPLAESDPDHLVGYRIRHPFTRVRGETITNQFGTTVVDLVRRERLMVPTVTLPNGPAPFVGHFQCYSIKRSRGTAKFTRVPGVNVIDRFGSHSATLLRPRSLCVPVDKNGEDPAVVDAADHLLCYRARTPRFGIRQNFFADNQLGAQQLDLIRRMELCVPSIRGSTTTTTTAAPTTTQSPGSPSHAFVTRGGGPLD
jgi:hypothetical protein